MSTSEAAEMIDMEQGSKTEIVISPESIRGIAQPFLDMMRGEFAEIERRRLETQADNTERRHKSEQQLQVLLLQNEIVKGRLDAHDVQLRAIVGDGTGQGGLLNELRSDLRNGFADINTKLAVMGSMRSVVAIMVQVLTILAILGTGCVWFFTRVH